MVLDGWAELGLENRRTRKGSVSSNLTHDVEMEARISRSSTDLETRLRSSPPTRRPPEFLPGGFSALVIRDELERR